MTDPMTDRELAGCALLPCPFCGSPAYMVGTDTTAIGCSNDQCIIWTSRPVPYNDHNHRMTAIAAWNRRTPSSEGDGRDAARYRWLRDLPDGSPYECIGNMPGDRWDDEIDAAIAAAEGGATRSA